MNIALNRETRNRVPFWDSFFTYLRKRTHLRRGFASKFEKIRSGVRQCAELIVYRNSNALFIMSIVLSVY